MTTPGQSFSASWPTVRFVALSATAMSALLAGDLPGACRETALALPEFFLSDRAQWLWRYRLEQVTRDPNSVGWITQATVSEPDGVVVGYGGFHGPPDEAGMVELGYTVSPEYRRRGYARAMLAALLHRAGAEPTVRTVRATISPDNKASLATIAGFGFVEVGEQWDDVDGLELVFELPLDA